MKQKKMPFIRHLQELRKRVIVSSAVFLLASLVSFPLVPFLLNRVREDLMWGVFFVVVSPQEALAVELKTSLLLGFILSFPFLAYQFWSFIAPGLIGTERIRGLVLMFSSSILFVLGGFFAYSLLLPLTLKFLIDVSYSVAFPLFSLNQTFNFILSLVLLFGLIFQLPLIVAVLSRWGVVDHNTLRSRRRHIFLGTLIVAAVITDPSVFTQILVAVPIILLYEVSIMVSWVMGGRG